MQQKSSLCVISVRELEEVFQQNAKATQWRLPMKTKLSLILIMLCSFLATSAFAQDGENSANDIARTEASNASAETAGASEASASALVEAMQSYYDSAKTYSADFVQDFESVDGIENQSSGTVWFKKPGLMRWDYKKPESRFLLSDGKYFWSWEPVYRQYCKQNIEAAQLPTALTFLAGKGRVEDDFNAEIVSVKAMQVRLKLTPKVPSTAYESILFDLLMPSAKVYRVTLNDSMGNTNVITFKSPELNAKLDAKLFKFNPPKDATHICQ